MAGFGGGTSRYGGRAGGFTTNRRANNSTPGSFGPVSAPNTGPISDPNTAGPRRTQAGPKTTSAGPGNGTGTRSYQFPNLPAPKPINVSAPKPGAPTSINVSAKSNPQLDALLNEQKSNIQDLKNNTGFAADVAAVRTADAFEGAKNAAKYAGGEGNSGIRNTRQNQITDAQLRAQAGQQADLALGREQMVTNAIQNQLGTIMGNQQGMLGQQQIGLGAEGLRQQAGRDQFNQGLAGQQFAAGVGFRNQDNAFRAAQQQLQGLQGVQGLYGGPWGPSGWGGGYGGY